MRGIALGRYADLLRYGDIAGIAATATGSAERDTDRTARGAGIGRS